MAAGDKVTGQLGLARFGLFGLGWPGRASVAPLVVNCPPHVHGQTGVALSFTFTASGGVLPYTWAVSGGSLPTGLTLNTSTGAVSGTPTVGGTFSFQISVTDAASTVAYANCGGGLGPSGGTGVKVCVDLRTSAGVSVNSFETGSPPTGTSFVPGREGATPGLRGRGVRPNSIGSFSAGGLGWIGAAFYFPDLQPQFGLSSKYLYDTMGGAISIDYGMRVELLTDGRIRVTLATWLPDPFPVVKQTLKGFAATPSCWYFLEFHCHTTSIFHDNMDGTTTVSLSIDWEVWVNDYNGPNGPLPIVLAPWFGGASWVDTVPTSSLDGKGVLKGGPFLGDNSCLIDDLYAREVGDRLGDGRADDYTDPMNPAWIVDSCARPQVTQVLYEVGVEEVAIPRVTEVLYEVGLQEVSVPQVTQALYEVGLAEHPNSFPEYIKRRNAPGNG